MNQKEAKTKDKTQKVSTSGHNKVSAHYRINKSVLRVLNALRGRFVNYF